MSPLFLRHSNPQFHPSSLPKRRFAFRSKLNSILIESKESRHSSMFASCPIATATATPFLSRNRLSSSRSSSGRGMSFTGAGCPTSPSRVTIEAFAETTSSRRRIDVRIPMAANLYEVLRVKETASQVEIKTAYRSLAKVYHPDAATSGSDARDFIAIHNAYATLSDPTARARYDLSIGGRRRFTFSSSSSAVGTRSGFAASRTRRWETDQCW